MNRAQDEGPSTPSDSGKPPGMKMGRAYQAAFEATFAVVVAGAAGGYADQRFDTAPIFLIAGVLLGFGTFVLRLVRLMNELAAKNEAAEGAAGGGTKEDGASPKQEPQDNVEPEKPTQPFRLFTGYGRLGLKVESFTWPIETC